MAHAQAEGTRAGDAPCATWARRKGQALEKAHASRFISFITQRMQCSSPDPGGVFSSPQAGQTLPSLQTCAQTRSVLCNICAQATPFPFFPLPFPGTSSPSSTMDARAGVEGLFALLQGHHTGTDCGVSQSPRRTCTTTTALFPQCLSPPAPAFHLDTHTCCLEQPGEDTREA